MSLVFAQRDHFSSQACVSLCSLPVLPLVSVTRCSGFHGIQRVASPPCLNVYLMVKS